MLDVLLPIDQIQAPKKHAQPTPKSGPPHKFSESNPSKRCLTEHQKQPVTGSESG